MPRRRPIRLTQNRYFGDFSVEQAFPSRPLGQGPYQLRYKEKTLSTKAHHTDCRDLLEEIHREWSLIEHTYSKAKNALLKKYKLSDYPDFRNANG